MRRYQRTLYDRMGEYPSLIIGPSGTGKELVARAIARSRFIPFDPVTLRFESDFQTAFLPINLSAFSPSLLESELFGHRRGAFTGALQDRVGWLELGTARDTVFLDEIGDVAPEIQVKLLRVIEVRSFHRLGETDEKKFSGKLIGATNRDLATAVASGQFRADFYYRLCGDVIETPGLAERFASSPEEKEVLALFLSRRLVGETDASRLAEEAVRWVESFLPNDYPWPGNVREFEQCIRNILIRGSYTPLRLATSQPGLDASHRVLTAEEMLRKYCTEIYSRTGSYEVTAVLLDIDRRTVKKYVTY
jgi:transcriptional regulator with GAF, ATPase, and Fis domain